MFVFLILFTLPTDILVMLGALIIRGLWGDSIRWSSDYFSVIARLKDSSWPKRTWYAKWAATTLLGHAIMISTMPAEETASTLKHEGVHVQQFEIFGAMGAVVFIQMTAMGYWELGLLNWTLFPLLGYLLGMLTAVIRGQDAYAGSSLERAASAIEHDDV